MNPESDLAHCYLDGLHGIEIGGAVHNQFGLNTINIDNSHDTLFKAEECRLWGTSLRIDLLAEGDELPLATNSLDFVITSHVLEHFLDPIKALKEWHRVVRDGGCIVAIVPHKERTFDKDRPRTPLSELIVRHRKDAPRPLVNEHFSVWIAEDIVELVNWLGWKLLEVQDPDDKVGNGFTVAIQVEKERKGSAAELDSYNGKEFFQVRKQRRALQLCTKGEQSLKAGCSEQALGEFDSALRMERHLLGVEYARAICLGQLKRYTEQEAALVSELRLQPDHADGLELLKRVRHYRRIEAAKESNRRLQPERIRVAVLSFDEIHTNCAGLRLLEPLLRLPEIELTWAIHIANRSGSVDVDALKDADLIVMQRMFPSPGTAAPLSWMLELGKPIIYEVDDFLLELPSTNPNSEFAMQCRPFVLDVMKKAAAITVSTEALRDELLQWNPDIHVLPNLIDERLWTRSQRPRAGPIVIGFTGTSTHGDDLRMVEDALIQIQAKYGTDVAFQFMGCATDRLAGLPGARVAGFTPDYASFARALQTTPMDIAIVSLENNRFNRSKSNIKWLEYSACGIAGVYSDLPPYNSCIRHGETGLLVGDRVQDWFGAIDSLVSNSSLRHAIAKNARQEVLSGYTLASPRVQLYADAYRAVLRRRPQDNPATSPIQPSDETKNLALQIRGIDLAKAVAQEPSLQGVVERVNRALGLGRVQMAARMVQKELGHRTESIKILAAFEEPV